MLWIISAYVIYLFLYYTIMKSANTVNLWSNIHIPANEYKKITKLMVNGHESQAVWIFMQYVQWNIKQVLLADTPNSQVRFVEWKISRQAYA